MILARYDLETSAKTPSMSRSKVVALGGGVVEEDAMVVVEVMGFGMAVQVMANRRMK